MLCGVSGGRFVRSREIVDAGKCAAVRYARRGGATGGTLARLRCFVSHTFLPCSVFVLPESAVRRSYSLLSLTFSSVALWLRSFVECLISCMQSRYPFRIARSFFVLRFPLCYLLSCHVSRCTYIVFCYVLLRPQLLMFASSLQCLSNYYPRNVPNVHLRRTKCHMCAVRQVS